MLIALNFASVKPSFGQEPCVPSEIIGPTDICPGNVFTYSILNGASFPWVSISINMYQPLQPYGIITQSGTNIYSGSGINTFDVVWNTAYFSQTSYATITVSYVDQNQCHETIHLNVYYCCGVLSQYPIIWGPIYLTTPTTYSIANNPPSGIYQLHGTMHIQSTVTLDAATFYMRPYAEIIVYPGAELIITNASKIMKHPDCSTMWNRIYAYDQTAKITINDGSILQDAICAIEVKNNAEVNLNNAILRDNYTGMKISEFYAGIPGMTFTPPYNCVTEGVEFTSTTPNHLLAYEPYAGAPPFTGILIDKVDGILIGPGEVGSLPNYFSYMLNGVYSKNSNVSIHYNHFSNFTALAEDPPGAGVYSFHEPDAINPLNFQPNLYVGPNFWTNGSDFTNCINGIKNHYVQATINQNVFHNCLYGIKITNTVSPTTIQHNDLFFLSTNSVYGTGIHVTSPYMVNKGIDLSIKVNDIHGLNTGIYLVNQAGTVKYHPSITDNVIQWANSNALTSTRTAINIQECNYSYIADNIIEQKNYIPDINDVGRLRGIRIAQSENAILVSNSIVKLGSGIYTNGSLLNTMFLCNTLNSCYHGFYFHEKTVLSDQGQTISDPCWVPNNRFLGNYNYYQNQQKQSQYINGTETGLIGPPIDWAVNQGLYEFELDDNLNNNGPPHPCNSFITEVPMQACNVPCQNVDEPDFYTVISDTSERDERFGMIVRDELYYDLLEEQYKWYEKEYLLFMMLNDTNMINLGGYNDYRYQQLYDSLMNGSTGQVQELYQYLENRQYSEAQLQNDLLQQNEVWVSNIKAVTDIYLRTWATGIMEIPEDDKDLLWPIALSTPYEGGAGVYTARVLLGIDPEEYAIPYRSIISESQNQPSDFRIIPNPAFETLLLVFNDDLIGKVEVNLYDLSGALQKSLTIFGHGNELYLKLDNLASGLYFCRVSHSGFVSKLQKLVVIH